MKLINISTNIANKITTRVSTPCQETIIASYKLDNKFIEESIMCYPERVKLGIIHPVIEVSCDGVSITITNEAKITKIISWHYFPKTSEIQIYGI